MNNADLLAKVKRHEEYLDAHIQQQQEMAVSQTHILEKVLKHEKHIDSHTAHLEAICKSLKKMEKTLEDFDSLSDLAENVKTVANFGKLLRLCIVWIAGLIGASALIWISIKDGFNK